MGGEGTLILSIQRSTPFSIVIRPELLPGQEGADQRISLEVNKTKAAFRGEIWPRRNINGNKRKVNNELVGYEEGRKISCWFSYDRDLLTLKYGKGYRMEQTTLMTYRFLKGDKEQDEQTRKQLKYIFSPTIRRRIEQYDIEPKKVLIQRYAERIRKVGFRGRFLRDMFPKFSSKAMDVESEALATSIIDIECMV